MVIHPDVGFIAASTENSQMKKHIILGTAGHIDHGKTSLIRALTGIDTDRLPEEKERGITIELGFAHLNLSDDIDIGIVDVPGHEKFVHHMVAGVGGMDVVMLVVAADEGIMPQTREHLAICQMLGVRRGLVVVTKIDMVDEEWLELVQDDIRSYLAGSFLEASPMVLVSSATGAGIDRLKTVLLESAGSIESRQAGGPFRLPVDRVFTIKGFGTVVTGTVLNGSVDDGESLVLIPGGPGCKIRGLQVHGTRAERIVAGQRAAVNIQNVDKDSIRRGMMLTRPGTIPDTKIIDAHLHLIPSAGKPLRNRAPIRFHSGTAELIGRILLMDREVLNPGDDSFVQFRLVEPTANLPGDRFVIRSYSPVETIGGGWIVDAEPSKHKRLKPETLEHFKRISSPDPLIRLKAILDQAGIGGLKQAEINRRFPDPGIDVTNLLSAAESSGHVHRIPSSPVRFISASSHTAFIDRLAASIHGFHLRHPLRPGISREELRTSLKPEPPDEVLDSALDTMIQAGSLAEKSSLIMEPGHQPTMTPEQKKLMESIVDFVRKAGLDGFTSKNLADALSPDPKILKPVFQHLVDSRIICRLPGSLFMDSAMLETVAVRLRQLLKDQGTVTVGSFRDALGISRKQAVPLLEHFDSIGLTRRKGDLRVLRE